MEPADGLPMYRTMLAVDGMVSTKPKTPDTLVVNLFGGPGAGKSTLAAALFAELKSQGRNVELVREYAKDKVWEGSTGVLSDQIYVFGKQLHRMNSVLGKVEVAITDSPLLLSLYYGRNESETFKQLVREQHVRVRSLNLLVRREKKFVQAGRLQTEAEARVIDEEIERIYRMEAGEYLEVTQESFKEIIGKINKMAES